LSDLYTSNNTLNSILNVTGTRKLGMSEVFQMQQYTLLNDYKILACNSLHIIIIMKRKLNHKKGIITHNKLLTTSLVLKRIRYRIIKIFCTIILVGLLQSLKSK